MGTIHFGGAAHMQTLKEIIKDANADTQCEWTFKLGSIHTEHPHMCLGLIPVMFATA